MRISLRQTVTVLTIALTSLLLVPAAHAADYYRSWTFFEVSDGAYVASQTGAGGVVPTDGSVEAYRFAAPADFNKPNLPRVDPTSVTFEAICGGTAAEAGQKRIAVIIDFGVEADSDGATVPEPRVACAAVPSNATAFQVLGAASEVRSKTSSFGPLVCGIDGYPATGCADQVVQTPTPADAGYVQVALPGADAPAATESTDDNESNLGSYLTIGVVVLLLVGVGGWLARRRTQA